MLVNFPDTENIENTEEASTPNVPDEETTAPEKISEDGEETEDPEEISEDAERSADPSETEGAAGSVEEAVGQEGTAGGEEEPDGNGGNPEGTKEEKEENIEYPDGLEELSVEEVSDGGPLAEGGVYAVLYKDGTLAFQDSNNSEISGGTMIVSWEVKMDVPFSLDQDGIPDTPWYQYRGSITTVVFKQRIAPKSVAFWFMGCYNLEKFSELQNLDVSNVTSMQNMFYGCERLKELTLIVNDKGIWDTKAVMDMRGCSPAV